MADITNPEAIAVCDAVVRPMTERLRAIYYELLAVKNTYGGQINTLFPAGEGTVLDGREDDGVSRLDADDVRVPLLFANTFVIAYENEGVAAMTKPCVRQFQAQ